MFKTIQQVMIVALCGGTSLMSFGATLNENDAKAVAADFLKAGAKDGLTLVHTAKDAYSNPVSYVFNATDGKGFVIVSADDASMPVIAYSTTTAWSADAMPDAARRVVATPVAAFNYGSGSFRAARIGQATNKVLETPAWSQEAPFNNNIPGRRLTGCVGVALAEILKYHTYPENRPAALAADGGATTYSWQDMRNDNYRTGYSMDEADAVAALVADAAIAIGTDFGMSSSSAFEVKVPYALTSMFGYDSGVSYKKRAEMDKASWDALIVNEIDEGRPVLYSGQDVSSGHAFVCDGYEIRGGAVYFHINWGWGGSANGYYASDALNPVVSRAHSYNDLTTIVYNIKPAADTTEWSTIHITSDERQPGLTIDVTDVLPGQTFTARAGALKNISNTDFNGKITVALFDAAGNFKSTLSDGRNFKLVALQTQKYLDFTCAVPAGIAVADGDVVRVATQESGATAWLPVAGDLLAAGEAKAAGAELPYFAINFPGASDDFEITMADNKVIKGRDFSFKVSPKSVDKVITVKANGFILTPDASNNYRITNALEDQEITVNVQNAADVLSKAILWVEAGKLQDLLDDNATATVKDLTLFGTINANDFAFIRDRMKLTRLDISQVNITATGANPANAIPAKALSGYRSLQTIVLPSNVTTFKSGCFCQTGLTSIEIPASVATFEYNIFVDCRALNEVIVRRSNPAWVNWCVFEATPKARLVVPVGASAAYKSKENWQDFKEIVEENPVAPSAYTVSVKEEKGLKFTAVTEGAEFAPGAEYAFTLDTDDSFGDAGIEVYANSTRLYPGADGAYHTNIKANTLIHVALRQPEATTVDGVWKITGAEGGTGLVTDVVNVPVGKGFTVRANAIKVPTGAEASKFYGIVLTDKNGAIKEFISPVTANYSTNAGNLTYNFTCQVNESTVKEGNELRLATSYNKKNWTLVNADADGIVDRIPAIGNKVIYHSINMPQSVNGANITGAATQIVRGMPFNFKVTPTAPTDRVTVAVNGVNKAVSAAVANISIPAVTEDLDITISVAAAGASDYVVVNVQEGELAAKIAECPDRLKLMGTILESEFAAFRAHAGNIVDLDLADLTIKGTAMTRNAIPSNAFAPTASAGTSALRTIILPSNLERISDNAFARCTALKQVTIPATVNYVGSGAFSACTALENITMLGATPPATGMMSPFPTDASKIKLEVPRGAESAYQGASFWNEIGPQAAKSYYWINFDKTRAFVYNTYYNADKIEVTNSMVQVSLGLPNCPVSSKNAGYYRPGVAFKVYDNGRDVLASGTPSGFAPDSYGYGGQYVVKFDPKVGMANANFPQNHTLDIVFFYPITFQNLAGAADVKAEIVNIEGDDRYNALNANYTYGATGSKTVYKEGKDYKFSLEAPSPNVVLSVEIENKIMTKAAAGFNQPTYETVKFAAEPDENGLYTIPALPGDTWVKISGYLHVEEGQPIASDDLGSVLKEEVENFTELAITGNMDAKDFQTVREVFESVETLDLSEIENDNIPANAFAGMENLQNVILPETVSEIGAGSFKDCENLESITIPGVTAIGEGAFEGCTSLTSIILPANTQAAGAPARAPRAGEGITAESFRGLNPNCIIYMADGSLADADHLNIVLNVDGHRVAASDIVLDGAHPFNAPASFSLGNHRISFTAEIPASESADINSGWKGIMLPFAPTGMTYGEEFTTRNGSGIALVTFADAEAEALTPATTMEANRPYLAHVTAPYASVPVTFYAEGQSDADNFVYDIAFTPVPEENVAAGKHFSLYGSYDGEARQCDFLTLDAAGSKFAANESATVRPFDAYLCANDGIQLAELTIGSHPYWVHNPEAGVESGSELYRSNTIELSTPTPGAVIYYTTDGSEPSDPESARKLYEAPFSIEADNTTVKAVAEFGGNFSDNVAFEYSLKKAQTNLEMVHNWNWISHNIDTPVEVADFAVTGIARILSQDEEATIDAENGITGSLKQLAPAVAYKVCVADEALTTTLEGVAYDPATAVSLVKGWNWIGCPAAQGASLSIVDLLVGLQAEEGDIIAGLEGFAQADADGLWKGSLSTLTPGAGYMYYSNSAKTFTYTMVEATEVAAQDLELDLDAPWVVDIHRYPSVMPVTAALVDGEGNIADATEYSVAAFCGNECRGIGTLIDGMMMINVHGEQGDNITFRTINADGDITNSITAAPFEEMPMGTFGEPTLISLKGTSAADFTVNDIYEIGTENGTITFTGDLTDVISVEIFDAAGIKVAMATPDQANALSIENIANGVHLIMVRTTTGNYYGKVMVK